MCNTCQGTQFDLTFNFSKQKEWFEKIIFHSLKIQKPKRPEKKLKNSSKTNIQKTKS